MYILRVSETTTDDLYTIEGERITVPVTSWEGPFKYYSDVVEYIKTNEVLEIMELT